MAYVNLARGHEIYMNIQYAGVAGKQKGLGERYGIECIVLIAFFAVRY